MGSLYDGFLAHPMRNKWRISHLEYLHVDLRRLAFRTLFEAVTDAFTKESEEQVASTMASPNNAASSATTTAEDAADCVSERPPAAGSIDICTRNDSTT